VVRTKQSFYTELIKLEKIRFISQFAQTYSKTGVDIQVF